MKTILIFLLLTMHFNASADTIDTWQIYHNRQLINQSEKFNKASLVFKINELTDFDSITIIYSSDTPCSNCKTFLKSNDGTKAKLIMATGNETSTPLTFKIMDLLRYHPNGFKGVIKIILFYRVGGVQTYIARQ